MKNLYDPTCVRELKERLARLKPDSARQWGKMNAAQALAHCAKSYEMALGERHAKRLIVGGIIGHFIKPIVFRDDKPFRRNSPTNKELIVRGQPDFEREGARLLVLIDRFAAAGPAGCTTLPHAFFGRLTPDEWSILMYKHLDHHLRQFGV